MLYFSFFSLSSFTCVDNNADVKGANYVYYLQEDGTMDPHSHILVRANYILEDNKSKIFFIR